jgi:hypothetical protein
MEISMNSKFIVALCLCGALGIVEASAATVRTVALSGQPAPGTLDGVSFRAFSGRTLNINNAGQIGFQGSLAGSGVDSTNVRGIWSEGSGSLALVARAGDHAPGTPSGVYFHSTFGADASHLLNDIGQTMFHAGLTGSDLNYGAGGNSEGIWLEESGSVTLVARRGDQPPGTPAGVRFDSWLPYYPLLNNAGHVAFKSQQHPSSVNFQGVWSTASGALAPVALSGSQAPGAANGESFSDFTSLVLNDAGKTAFRALLSGTGWGIWFEQSSGLSLAARSGDQAHSLPSGVSYSGSPSERVALNNAGQLAFHATLAGAGINSTNNQAIWSGAPGSFNVVVRTGDQAPGAPNGANFLAFQRDFQFNNAGQVAVLADLVGSGVNSSNDTGIWMGDSGGLSLVAREGEQAPGTPSGITFQLTSASSNLRSNPLSNDAGQTAFFADLTGNGVDSTNSAGVWATDRAGELQLIARTGDLLQVAPDDFRTISSLLFRGDISSLNRGRTRLLNNAGQIVFGATFTDGTSGVFVSNAVAVPEPSTLLIGALAVMGLLNSRRPSR